MSAETNMYSMYPDPEQWGSLQDNRRRSDHDEHRAAFNGGLGHPTDYGVEAMTLEGSSRPLSAEVAAVAVLAQTKLEQ